MKQTNQYERMTQSPLGPLIISLSIPTIISMLVTNIYNMADTAFVGTLGNSASGAVGVVFGFMAILQSIGFMFGQGSGSMVARLLGKEDPKSASKIASTGFFAGLCMGILLMILGFLFLDPLVDILGSTETIAPYAKTYISFILCAAPLMVPSFVMNNVLRYEGHAALGMIGLLTGGILNILLDMLFIFGLQMGIAGAGLATALSQTVSFCILLSMFLSGKTQCKLSIRLVEHSFGTLANICTTGMPSLLRQALMSITTMILNHEAGIYGDEAVAAMSIASRIAMFVFSFALGIGQGFQPVSGFNYGAGKYDRVKKAFGLTCIFSEIVILVMGAFVFFNAEPLALIFREDVRVAEIAVRALRLQCVSQLLIPPCMVTEMMFQSTGHKIGAILMSSMRSGLFFIPLLIILADLRGLNGIQEAQPLAYAVSVLPTMCFCWWFFKKVLNVKMQEMVPK